MIIVGGGLAGLTAAVHLSQSALAVLVIEKKHYPHHKVCGEYVSNEVLPYFARLGVQFEDLAPPCIDTLVLSTVNGDSVRTPLPLGGFGLSRFAFDHALYQKAVSNKVDFMFKAVTDIQFKHGLFNVHIDGQMILNGIFVIGAYGKRSALDKILKRGFVHKKSHWLAVKAHYNYDGFLANQVELHNFKGGYAGLSKTETGAVNFCYLANYGNFKEEGSIAEFNTKVVAQNPFLSNFFKQATPIFDAPMAIAQIVFGKKKAVENHMLMCGDTAGMIHPLCGNGMAMAIHSGKIAAEGIVQFFNGSIKTREALENSYQVGWERLFGRRLWWGRQLQSLFLNDKLAAIGVKAAIASPTLLRTIIKSTHGVPIK